MIPQSKTIILCSICTHTDSANCNCCFSFLELKKRRKTRDANTGLPRSKFLPRMLFVLSSFQAWDLRTWQPAKLQHIWWNKGPKTDPLGGPLSILRGSTFGPFEIHLLCVRCKTGPVALIAQWYDVTLWRWQTAWWWWFPSWVVSKTQDRKPAERQRARTKKWGQWGDAGSVTCTWASLGVGSKVAFGGLLLPLSQRRVCFLDLKKQEKLETQIRASPVHGIRLGTGWSGVGVGVLTFI